mgnify:CR=1 FL=1
MELPHTLVVLCPNHTGRGQALGVWPEGAWLTPLAPLPVDADLAAALIERGDGNGGFAADMLSHLGEHAVEVVLPFLQVAAGEERPLRITPVCVGTQQPEALRAAGQALADVLAGCRSKGQEVGVIVSSDMNHYEDERRTVEKDALALERALACDPEGLLAVAARERISMCGAGPLALALLRPAVGRRERNSRRTTPRPRPRAIRSTLWAMPGCVCFWMKNNAAGAKGRKRKEKVVRECGRLFL